ncbi:MULTISPECIES: cytidylyltransferase domain-containing protein [unclassified Legionella]|uniref:acylneuraminate cytidylyltransferase family protein n=1 Tax=unclassified Legionella TaxID=2622702 RepID=UPI001055CA62|nr:MULTISPECIES: acylneuraminate cytidylyltransferase family protein [unclassified Legionella]MDI9817743.1 acylneuraminate cytidylyltransferase family protein [Legionella sp. PL877]
MKILAIIPARAGSKRVPGKNTKLLAGLPLIAHTIRAAQQSLICDEILVSTDCPNIAETALKYGASVPWLRPKNLADDLSDVIHAVVDTIRRYEAQNRFFDSVLLLQPTSPFRSPNSIVKAVELHKKNSNSVVSVHISAVKPAWFKIIDRQGNLIPSSQAWDLSDSTLYQLNGSIYLASTQQILLNNSLYSEPTKALLIEDPREAIDIDTPLDWALAEKLMELKEEEVVT